MITISIFKLPFEATNPEKGKIISLGIGAKKLSINIAKPTPQYPTDEIKLTNHSIIELIIIITLKYVEQY
jgi:hypothetical protein